MKLLFCLNSFLFLIFLIFLECSFSIISPETIKQLQSHTFIGVYGFPNSGSDWIHEVLRFTPGVSTIHEGCAKKHGNQVEKQCTNSQYSGIAQTSNGRKGSFNLRTDILCTINPNQNIVQTTASIISELFTNNMWSPEDTYFAEASTRLALRIPLLKLANDGLFGDQKYLISIKHPICVESGFSSGDWLEAVQKHQLESAVEDIQILLDVEGNKKSAEHRDDTICDGYDNSKRGTSWLSFMKILSDFLKGNEEWTLKHVRIVRYEDFQSRPVELCRKLFHFLFLENQPSSYRTLVKNHSSPYYWTEHDIENVCVDLFPALKPTIAPTPSSRRKLRTSKSIKNSHNSHNSQIEVDKVNPLHHHRQLKRPYNRKHLVTGGDYHTRSSLNYNPAYINATCGWIMNQYRTAYKLFDDDSRETLESYSAKISQYGYAFDPYNFYTETDALGKWNIMK